MPAGCDGESCDQAGTLVVYAGDTYEDAQPQGWYCVGHAALVSSELGCGPQRAVWVDWIRIRKPTLRIVPGRDEVAGRATGGTT